jgi:hypothetical protein
MNDPSQVITLPLFASNEWKNTGVIRILSLTSVLFFIFLIPWGDGVFDGLPRFAGILSFVMTFLYLVVHGSHKNYNFSIFLRYFMEHGSYFLCYGLLIKNMAWKKH